MSDTWVSLHSHSDHSRLDGAATIKGYLTEAKRQGMPAFALTDHGTLSGHWDLYQQAKKIDIKPIAGVEAYIAPAGRLVKEPVYWGTPEQRKDDISGRGAYTHLTILALNSIGLRNLYRMQHAAASEGFYYHPRLDLELLSQHSEGLLVTTGCPGSATSTKLRLGQEEGAIQYASDLRDIFGENLFVEVMRHEMALDDELIPLQLMMARRLGLPVVATNDCHYLKASDNKTHDAMLALQTGSRLTDEKRFRFDGCGYHLKTIAEMRSQFSDIPDALKNTLVIAERVTDYNDVFAFQNRMPHLPGVDPEFEDEALAEITYQRLNERFPGNQIYKAQVDYELDVISEAGFPGYFLVLGDILTWAKQQGIRVGPGRGSAGASLVCYLNDITGLDPIVHGLPFERFLNLDRVSMPDIDIDFEIDRRGEVVEYAKRRYGIDNVSNILTLGTIKAKAAIKDATRVLDYPYALGDEMTKAFPQPIHGFMPTLDCVTDPSHARYEDASAFRRILAGNPQAQEVFDLATGLEGMIRQFGVHAAGVIISSDPLHHYMPVKFVEGNLVTGFDQPAMEPMGAIKYDFLGLENLTILEKTLKNIRKLYDKDVVLEDLPLTDVNTYQMLAEGKALGVFQLDGVSMRRLLKRMRPSRFEDISAVLALFRPGPMGADAHNTYADRKTGKLKVEPIHPEFADSLKEILEPTYGVICYQEQVMAVLQKVAGYTPGQADGVRRIMGKKKPEEMAKLEPELREKMVANGYTEDAFNCLWEILVPFASYSFNRAHTAAYGLIAYWTAYLKANYPIAFFAALLSSEADDLEKLGSYLEDARSMGVKILPPDINDSDYGFTPTTQGIRFGLSAIKGVGEAVISSIRANGRISSLKEFYAKIPDKVNVRSLQALIAGGAFDSFGDRVIHYENAPAWIELAKGLRKLVDQGNIPLIQPSYVLPRASSNKKQMRLWEKEIVGIELTLLEVRVQLKRPLSNEEWAWVNTILLGNQGTQKVVYSLNAVNFSSQQLVTPSTKLVRQLRALDSLVVEME